MKEKLKKLSKAFEKQAEGLDGIIEALTRTAPVPPDPYDDPQNSYFVFSDGTRALLTNSTRNESEHGVIGAVEYYIYDPTTKENRVLTSEELNSVIKIRIGTNITVTNGFWTLNSYDPTMPTYFATYGLDNGAKYSYFPNLVELEINQEIPINDFNSSGACSHLEKLTIGSSINGSGSENGVFSNTFCPNLKEVTFNGDIDTSYGIILDWYEHLSSVTYPTSATGTLVHDPIGLGSNEPFTVTVPSGFNFTTSDEVPYFAFQSHYGLARYTFEGRKVAQLQAMPGYPWGLNNGPHDGMTIHCSDGDITFPPRSDS